MSRLKSAALLSLLFFILSCNPKHLELNPPAVELAPGGSFQFQIKNSNLPPAGLRGNVLELDGGTITAEGLYTAPDHAGLFHVSINHPEWKGCQVSSMVKVEALSRFETVGESPAQTIGQTATALLDGRVLICGGFNYASSVQLGAYLYDPATNRVQGLGSLLHPRSFHTATLISDGSVLLLGGRDELLWATQSATSPVSLPSKGVNLDVPEAERFDPKTLRFEKSAVHLLRPRSQHTTTLLADGRVLVVGGLGSTRFASGGVGMKEQEIVEAELISKNGMIELISPSRPRIFHTATRLLDGRVLIAAGSRTSFGDPTDDTEIFLPDSRSFKPGPHLNLPRTRQAAALLPDGDVLLVGGDKEGVTAEKFEPGTETMTRCSGGLSQPARGPLAVSLSDGRVLVLGFTQRDETITGGTTWYDYKDLSHAEVYLANRAVFESFPAGPNVPRTSFSVALMRNGRVLMAGGSTQGSGRGPISVECIR